MLDLLYTPDITLNLLGLDVLLLLNFSFAIVGALIYVLALCAF